MLRPQTRKLSDRLERIKTNSRQLWYFCVVVLADAYPDKFHDWGKIQKEMCDFLQDPTSDQKFLSAFRLSFKTTCLLGYMVWDFCWSIEDGKPSSLIYVTATKENVHLISDDFRHILLNCPLLHEIFPWLPKEKGGFDKFTKDGVELRHVKTHFSSYETTLVSRHYPKWINDDLENDENSLTDTSRAAIINKWRLQKAILFKVRKKRMGLEIESGTPYHYQGLNWKIRQMKSYSKLIIPSETPDGQPTFPELYTIEDLRQKREEMGTSLYSAQFLLRPLAAEDALCPEEWLKYWEKPPELAWRVLIVDAGGSEPGKNDPSGITIVDHAEDGNMYVVFAEELWLSSVELVQTMIRLKEQYKPDDIRIEKEKYATTVADVVAHHFPQLRISFVEHKGRSKPLRIWRLRQWFQTRSIYISPNQTALRDQILSYPSSLTGRDDLLDSLSYQIDCRRVPKRAPVHTLPSGQQFVPAIDPSFEEELDKYFKGKYEDKEARLNDSRY